MAYRIYSFVSLYFRIVTPGLYCLYDFVGFSLYCGLGDNHIFSAREEVSNYLGCIHIVAQVIDGVIGEMVAVGAKKEFHI